MMTFRRRSIGSRRPVRSSLRVGLHFIVRGPSCSLCGQLKKLKKPPWNLRRGQSKDRHLNRSRTCHLLRTTFPTVAARPTRWNLGLHLRAAAVADPRGDPPCYLNWREHKFQKRLKDTVAWDFLSKVISQKVPNRSSDSWSKAVSNIDSNSLRNSTFTVFLRYGPLWRILLSAMGHYGRFGYALWANQADLIICYGPLRRIWFCAMGHCVEWSHTVKICIDFCAMGHSEGFC
jgi:hypothetical protein